MKNALMDESQAVSHQDQDLKRRIVNYLLDRNRHSLRSLNVDVEKGMVVIKGCVDTFYEKQLCLHCCQRVAGVIRLVDEIEVAA